MKTTDSIAGRGRPFLRTFTAAALCATALLVAPAPAWAQLEIKVGHVGEPGSLFQLSADEFAKRANARLAGKAARERAVAGAAVEHDGLRQRCVHGRLCGTRRGGAPAPRGGRTRGIRPL